mgnify:CR=1 FL=1
MLYYGKQGVIIFKRNEELEVFIMDKDKMIDDIVAMLDGSVKKGDGHINVQVNDIKSDEKVESEKNVSRGCADNSINPMACCVPTIELPDDDEFEK